MLRTAARLLRSAQPLPSSALRNRNEHPLRGEALVHTGGRDPHT